ncbi:MAG TPA: hypothetical protein VNU93_04470 [Verrucomicrobiae bacterium]|nr:hypothetical protein [Verrucomicrobiae bacterium]
MSRTTFRVAATYIGAVMGAGFASGQEILQFFVSYGSLGIAGIVLAGTLFAVLGWGSLTVIKRYRISTYQELFVMLLGPRLGRICEIIITLFLFAGLVIMLAGSGAIFHEYLNLSPTLGVILTALAVLVALSSKGEGVLWINTVLIPVKLLICLSVCLIVIGLSNNGFADSQSLIVPHRPWYFSAVLYVSFNLTFAQVVLASLGAEMRGNTAGGILGGIGLGVFALVIGLALLVHLPEASTYQVPMVYIAFRLGPSMGLFYLMVLWFAMITAAVGNAFSFCKRIESIYHVSYGAVCVFTLIAAIPLAHLRFSALISVVYPLFGYIGLFTLAPLLYIIVRGR